MRFGCPSTTAAGRAGEVSPLVVDLGCPSNTAAGAVSPLVVDLGCGFGVGLLSLVQPSSPVLPSSPVQPSTAVNVLGCDACALKVGYARGVAARWGVSHAARFVCASAEATVAHVAAGEAAAPLLGVMAYISPISPLYLPYNSPTSPLYLPYISRRGPVCSG